MKPQPPETAPPPGRDELLAENADLKRQVAAASGQSQAADPDEKTIAAKMRRGLTRAEAKTVIQLQREHDAGLHGEQGVARASHVPKVVLTKVSPQ